MSGSGAAAALSASGKFTIRRKTSVFPHYRIKKKDKRYQYIERIKDFNFAKKWKSSIPREKFQRMSLVIKGNVTSKNRRKIYVPFKIESELIALIRGLENGINSTIRGLEN